jgi:hypothetical protein
MMEIIIYTRDETSKIGRYLMMEIIIYTQKDNPRSKSLKTQKKAERIIDATNGYRFIFFLNKRRPASFLTNPYIDSHP